MAYHSREPTRKGRLLQGHPSPLSAPPSCGTPRCCFSTGNATSASTSRSATRRNAADANPLAIRLHSAKPTFSLAPSARSRTPPTSTRATSPAARKHAAVRTRRFAVLCASSHTRPRTGRALLSSLSHAARISSSRNRVMRCARLPRRIRR
jgi:hypothetical protein